MRDQTLELYVKMCDCPEIQGQNTRYNDGDLYVERADIGKKESPIGVWCWNCEGEFYLGGEAERLFVNSVWLPTQAHLQEMVSGQFFTYEGNDEAKMPDPSSMIHHFSEFYSGHYEYASYEEAWLSFVMHELYNKLWNGESWVENKTEEDS